MINEIVKKCQTKEGQFSAKRIALLSSDEIEMIVEATQNLDLIWGNSLPFLIRLKYLKFQPQTLHCVCGKPLKFSPSKDNVFRVTCGDQKCAKTPTAIDSAKKKFHNTIKQRQETPVLEFSLREQIHFVQTQIKSGTTPNYFANRQEPIARYISTRAKALKMKVTQYCFHLINLDGNFDRVFCPVCNMASVSFLTFEKGYSKKCERCGKKEAVSNRKNTVIKAIQEKLDKEGALIVLASPGINSSPWEFKCSDCGEEFQKWLKNGRHQDPIKCPRCFPATKSSYEYNLVDWLKTVYTGEIIHSYQLKNSRKSIDVYIPEKRLGIEINGIYWHSDDKFRHKEKLDLCSEENIDLVQFTDLELDTKYEITKSMLRNKLGISEKFYARKTEIHPITSNEYRNFCEENHIKGSCPATIKIGGFHKEDLLYVISLSKSRFTKDQSYEIIRFCSKINTSIIGGFSKMISYVFESFLEINKIISYVDLHHGNGHSYHRIGFTEESTSEPNYFYWKGTDKLYSRNVFQKHKLKRLFPKIYSDAKTEKAIMEEAGFRRYYDCGNRKFSISRENYYGKT